MNQRGSVWRFRENQDFLVMLVQNTRGGPKAFDYKPLMLTMQLSHTESTVALVRNTSRRRNQIDLATDLQDNTGQNLYHPCNLWPKQCAPRSEDRRGALPSNHAAACRTAE